MLLINDLVETTTVQRQNAPAQFQLQFQNPQLQIQNFQLEIQNFQLQNLKSAAVRRQRGVWVICLPKRAPNRQKKKLAP